jgi:hypothetical protein
MDTINETSSWAPGCYSAATYPLRECVSRWCVGFSPGDAPTADPFARPKRSVEVWFRHSSATLVLELTALRPSSLLRPVLTRARPFWDETSPLELLRLLPFERLAPEPVPPPPNVVGLSCVLMMDCPLKWPPFTADASSTCCDEVGRLAAASCVASSGPVDSRPALLLLRLLPFVPVCECIVWPARAAAASIASRAWVCAPIFQSRDSLALRNCC